MADDLGDEWWLNDDENNGLDTQITNKTQQSKRQFVFRLTEIAPNIRVYEYFPINAIL